MKKERTLFAVAQSTNGRMVSATLVYNNRFSRYELTTQSGDAVNGCLRYDEYRSSMEAWDKLRDFVNHTDGLDIKML